MEIKNSKTDLKVRCYFFSISTIKFLNTLPEKKVYWVIADQLLRSTTSIGANIVEAKSSSSRKDFIKFYEIALKSANESKYWFGLLRDATDADKETVYTLLNEVNEISNMLGASVITLKNKKF
ncbi:MAG: four helix bundle protein [Candidatus Magasanikbacteria bacterium]|jgi:four helix bundle protein